MRFSEREGFKPVRQALQIGSIDKPLRNGLWNILDWYVLEYASTGMYGEYEEACFYDLIWLDFYKERHDEKPTEASSIRSEVEHNVFKGDWFEIYDLVEFALQKFRFDYFREDATNREDFISSCNRCLEEEMSGYRIIGDIVTRIISEPEIAAVEEAMSLSQQAPVAAHIRRALELLSDRKRPDYRNSIKEAISAVESMCCIVSGNAKTTLSDALKQLAAKGVNLHPALREAFSRLYGYTSDAQGIRHALMENANLDFEDAKFMLVSCSAFINLLKARARPEPTITS